MDMPRFNESRRPPFAFTAKRNNFRYWACLGLLSIALVLVTRRGSSPSWDTSLREIDIIQRDLRVEHDAEVRSQEPVSLLTDNGRTNQVQWDNYSIMLRGQRIFLYSGEFHTFRLPVPSLWLDILQKIKAAGLNGISVYTHAGLLNPSPGVTDLNDFRDLQPLFDAAKQTGIWIVLRPGPYINAETTAGGLPHWMTSQISGALRTNASDFHAAWQDYIKAIITATGPNQITNGGPVIAIQVDNEYYQSAINGEYFAELEADYHNSSIVVPLTYNDPGEGKNFVNGTGAVDIYGLDSYPQGFDCSNPTHWSPVTTNYHDYHANTNPSQPFYLPEFQGGSFDAWGPTAPGYGLCQELTGTDFQSVFNLGLWAANAKMISYYMVYGGTSWGAIPYHGVYTSYDYGSAISENRNLTAKYDELKRQALFLRSSPEFYKTDWVGNTTTGAVTTNDSSVFAVLLRNPDTAASFYIVRQADSTSMSTVNFKMNVTTPTGNIELPQAVSSITIGGRQSKIILTNYTFGQSKLLYTTAQVFFAGRIGQRDVLFLHGDSDQEHEVSLPLTGTPKIKSKISNVSFTTSLGGQTVISLLSGIEGFITIYDSDEQLILYADSVTAATFWAPVIAGSSHAEFANYWQLGSNSSILVGGPYLVRNATISGTNLALIGDLQTGVRLFVTAPESISSITWNGEPVSADAALTGNGVFVGQVQPKTSASSITAPILSNWKYSDSLPEIQAEFSDASWAVANHTTTNIPFKPYYGDRILYGCDYGFCENIVLWRGHFNATGNEKSMNLSINGGEAFAASVWVNDVFLNTSYGNSTNNKNVIEETDDMFIFPEGSLLPGKDNIITVVQDNMGLNETNGAMTDSSKSPRGIRGFKLDDGTFSEWKVQGKVGGYTNYPDKVRGVLNEGGLYGEREGWHLPGFDTSSWEQRDLSSGLPDSAAGVGFFVTTFDLNVPSYNDVFMSFTFDQSNQPYRAYLFVNGWMMGKRIANLGPQFKFPVHQGILDYNGQNTVAVALWAMEPNTTVKPTLELTVDGVLEGGVGGVTTNNPKWSPRSQV